ncbi:MAG TPA: S8 family serine peptidase [Candidatus Binatia bacterium]|nr:S8 family serine peptidase [Candidatus Binatia bacterium]
MDLQLRPVVAATLVLLGLGTAPAGAAGGPTLEISTPEGRTTRAIVEGSAVVVSTGVDPRRATTVLPPAASDGSPELVIVELRGAPLVRRVQARATRAPQSAHAAIAAEHRRVVDEIARLDGGAARARGLGPGPVRREYTLLFNGIAATLDAAAQAALAAHPDVRAIRPDREVKAVLDTSVPFVRAPAFWSRHGGYRGSGRVIAVVDTGIDYTHADLGACTAVGAGCKVAGGYDFQNGDDDPLDDYGHGTHVAAIAAGNGSLLGVAPDATLLAYKVLDAYGNGLESTVIAGIEGAVDPNGDLDTSDHVDVINLSLGGPGGPDDPGAQAVDGATAAGVLVVAAAGNSGGYYTVGSPGVARTALTVGAISEAGAAAAYFTSGGPTADTFDLKPEISAPGVNICAARAAGTELGATCIDATHVVLDGTSMATPHVAGAAALLRGVFPALSPADVKSLLAQNGRPSNDSALQVGASILDVSASGSAETVVDPQTLSFGLDDLLVPTWAPTRTLTVRNVGATARSYTIGATGHAFGLPAGATVTFDPASFSLSPGQSRTIQVALTVDNAAVPNQTTAPSAYEAMIELRSTGETQRVPMIFIKSPLLRIQTDQVATLVYAHDRSSIYNAYAVVPAGTTVDMLVPAGTYDVIMMFSASIAAYVVHEGIVVTDRHDEIMSSTEASHTVSLAGKSEVGSPLTESIRAITIYHRASGLGLATLSSGAAVPFAIPMSSMSSAYDVDLALMAQPGDRTYLVNEGLAGVSESAALANTPSQLTHGAFRYYANPGETPSGTMEFLSVMVGSTFGFGLGPPPVSPVDRDFWVAPAPRPGARIFVQPAVLLTGNPDTSHNCPWYRGATASGVIQAFNALDPDDPVYETSTGELPLDLGPASLFVKLVSTNAWLQARNVAAAWTWTFHSPGGDGPEAPGGTIGYRLLANDHVVASGVMPQSGFGGPFLPFLFPLAARPYVLETDPLPYWIGGVRATARIAASFDTRSYPADVDPPYLRRVEVRSAGALAEVVPVGMDPTVLIEAHDDVDATVALSLQATAAGVKTLVPVVPIGPGVYEATLTGACDDGGAVDLLVSAADSSGNRLDEWLTPAFVCRSATCGNWIIEPGEACDDGNQVSGDGCNAVCSSTERCGDGVLDAGEACDDGNTTGGDCCSATCRPERAGSACDDGLFCDGADACDSLGACARHGAPPCASGPECATSCDESIDACGPAPAGESCSSDGNGCTADACDGVGACAHEALDTGPCDDGVFCNGADACAAGACTVHAGDPCDGGGECADTCQEASDDCFSYGGTACTDDGEICTIDICNGAGLCIHPAAHAGLVCRSSSDACDVAEECDGVLATCPPDTGLADSDRDGLCDGLDPCTNVAGARDFTSPPVARLRLGRIFADATPGNDLLTVSGTFNLPTGTSFFRLFPLGGIARVVLVDGLGAPEADVVLPSGSYSNATKRGWSQSRNAKSWTYRDRTGTPPGGIQKLVVRTVGRSADVPGGPAKLTLSGRNGTYPFTDANLPANVVVTLGNQAAAAAGRCAESAFPAGTCGFNGARTQATCIR